MRLLTFGILFLLATHSFALQSDCGRVNDDLKVYDQHVADLNSVFDKIPVDPNNKDWAKKKLAHMVEVDQYMRNYSNTPFEHQYSEPEKQCFAKEFGIRWALVDSKNTADLKDLLKIYEWFKISEFDAQTDQNAWLLVQHADADPDFQKSVLTILTKLYPKETSGRNYAYLYDRVAASWNDPKKQTPQRYGTQGMCKGPSQWEPIPIEDPTNLDKRRAEVGLGTEAEYMEQVKTLCH